MEKIIKFFDRFEDRVRHVLSHKPILYAFLGGVGIVLFWKGVWETAEYFPILDGIGSVVASILLLLAIGLFVSSFIGDSILITGLKSQKKITEKTEAEVSMEESGIVKMNEKINKMERDIEEIKMAVIEKNGTGKKAK